MFIVRFHNCFIKSNSFLIFGFLSISENMLLDTLSIKITKSGKKFKKLVVIH